MSAPRRWLFCIAILIGFFTLVVGSTPTPAQKPAAQKKAAEKPSYPPKLPGEKSIITMKSDEFLKRPEGFNADVPVAKTAPTVDFLYYPCQTYPGSIWSNWGDGLAVGTKYYSSIGDHDAPNGNAFVYEYDSATQSLRQLTDLKSVLKVPEGQYTPGKIHGRLDLAKDGCLYFSTHRGSTRVTKDDTYGYKGDWILKCNPKTGQTEVVVHGPVPKHCIPNSMVDPERMIFYGGTASGSGAEDDGIQFFAYDLTKRKLLYSGPNGPGRAMMLASSTGRLYYVPGNGGAVGSVMRFDPREPQAPMKLEATLGLRAATHETPGGIIYTISQGSKGEDSILHAFNTQTEKATVLGPASVGKNTYVASLDADPTGRYLYYIPGAHGGSEQDGTAVIQFDTKRKTKKVLAFLEPYARSQIGGTLRGTYSTAVDPKGEKLYVTWNINRSSKSWDTCGMTVIHIPASERPVD
jgi:hypothetical protein